MLAVFTVSLTVSQQCGQLVFRGAGAVAIRAPVRRGRYARTAIDLLLT